MAYEPENVDNMMKIIVVGDGQVGKTSMLTRYVKGHFTAEYKKTIGTEFFEKDIYLKQDDEPIKLQLWDTAGQEVYADLCRRYYHGSGGCVLAFSTTNRDSFEAIESWRAKVEAAAGKAPVMVLVQTKCDFIDTAEKKVEEAEAEALAKKLGLKFFRTSTKKNFQVNEVFQYLAEAWRYREPEEGAMPAQGQVDAPAPSDKKGREGFAEGPAPTISLKATPSEGGEGKSKGKQRAKGKKRGCSIL